MPTVSLHGRLARDYFVEVGFGTLDGYRRITALGNVQNVPSSTSLISPQDVWPGGGTYPWPSVAVSLEAVSSSAADAAAGTGARTILVQGLNAAFVEIQEIVTLNGISAVALANQYYRVNGVFVMSAGTGKVNAGQIDVRDSGGGTVRQIVQAGYGIARAGLYTVPAAHTLAIQAFVLSVLRLSNQNATIAVFSQAPTGFYRLPLELTVGSATPYLHDTANLGIVLPEKFDFAFRCTGASISGTEISAAFIGVLKRNTA